MGVPSSLVCRSNLPVQGPGALGPEARAAAPSAGRDGLNVKAAPAPPPCRWDPGSLLLPPPPLHLGEEDRAAWSPAGFRETSPFSDACGRSRDDAMLRNNGFIHPGIGGRPREPTQPPKGLHASWGSGAKARWAAGGGLKVPLTERSPGFAFCLITRFLLTR